jgi:hypothetical protein
MSTRTRAAAAAILGLTILSSAVQAQTYRCNVGGTTYIQDKPCAPSPSTDGQARLGTVGPARVQPSTSRASYTPALQPAPEHQRFLSQRCAELNDAIRTAPTRGVGSGTIADLRREYSRTCSDDEQYAYQQASAARSKEREGVQAKRRADEQSRVDAQRLQERCIALRDALRNRRAQTEAEITSKRVAEEAYNASCLGR